MPGTRSLAIVLLCVAAAVSYGVLHDQITARISIEYFTIGHPPVFGTRSPTLLALGWGVLATWWAGLLIGVVLALAARVGPWPKWTARRLVRPLAVLAMAMAAVALLAGVAGWVAALRGWVWLLEPIASRVPATRHVAFLAALWVHTASYAVGFIGGVVLCVWVIARRIQSCAVRR